MSRGPNSVKISHERGASEMARRRAKGEIDEGRLLSLLEGMLLTHSPSGEEAEMEALIEREVSGVADEFRRDDAGNLVAKVEGRGEGPPLVVLAHVDEIGMSVKRVEEDGRIRVEALGGSYPWKYGEGPVDVLAEGDPIPGVLSVGCVHVSEETKNVHEAKTKKPLGWDMVYVLTALTREELTKAGVRAGTRVVVSRERKRSFRLGERFLCGYALDNKGGCAILCEVLKALKASSRRPPRDVWFVFTTGEELGAAGASFALRALPPHLAMAVDTSPVEREYGVENSERPIVWFKDSYFTYDKRASDALLKLADELGFGAQAASYSSAGTDSSIAKRYGITGRAVCLGFPTQNTHGFEVSNVEGIVNTARLALEFARRGEW